MDRFHEMQVFAAVVEAGSFTAASHALDMSKAAVSRYVAELGARSGEASGLLKVNVPVTFGLMHLAPLWPAFLARLPRLSIDITLSDRVADLVEEGFDAAVRIGQLPASSLISRKLASTRLVACASPDYLRRRGMPVHPDELRGHDVISYSLFASGENWNFSGPEGEVSVKVVPRMRTNSGDTCRAAELGIHAVYPSRKFLPPKVRLLLDFLVEAFAAPAWEG